MLLPPSVIVHSSSATSYVNYPAKPSSANTLAQVAGTPFNSPDYYQNRQIVISSNSEFTQVNGVVSGNGSSDSPYVLSGLNLLDNGTVAINLQNTDAYVEIKNISICMAVLPSNTTETQTGIYLQGVSHVDVENVSIFSPQPEPVVLSSSGEPLTVGLGVSMFDSDSVSFGSIMITNITSGFSINNSNNIIVANSTMSRLPNRDIFAEFTNDSILEDNIMGGLSGNLSYQNGYNGYNFQFWKGHNDTFVGNVGSDSNGDNIWLYRIDDAVVVGNTFSVCPLQSILETNGVGDIIANNTVYSTNQAIALEGGSQLTVSENMLSNDTNGIWLGDAGEPVINASICGNILNDTNVGISVAFASTDVNVYGNTITASSVGLSFDDTEIGSIFSNYVYLNDYGLEMNQAGNYTVYNNYFDNTNNAISNSPDLWNEPATSGLNILGGKSISGNYWSNYGNASTGSTSIPYTNGRQIQYGGDCSPLLPDFQGMSFDMGDVIGGYQSSFEIPVEVSNASTFLDLNQVFSFDYQALKFDGVARTLSSNIMDFSYSFPQQGILEISGSGLCQMGMSPTTMYYLIFSPLLQASTNTTVLLDSSSIGGIWSSQERQSNVTLGPNWTNIGPQSFAEFGAVPSETGSGATSIVELSQYYPNVIYAASSGSPSDSVLSYGGVYVSTDYGTEWKPVNLGLPSTAVLAMAVDPFNPRIVVVSLGDPLTASQGYATYKTVDGGASWQETYLNSGFALYANQTGGLYEVTSNSLIVSNDFGSTWHQLYAFKGTTTTATFLDGGRTIYVGLTYNGAFEVLKSSDGGLDFSELWSTSASFVTLSHIEVDPSNASVVWAVFFDYPVNTLYLSLDGGNSFEPANLTEMGVEPGFFIPGEGFCPQ